jgi:hypothetical protein
LQDPDIDQPSAPATSWSTIAMHTLEMQSSHLHRCTSSTCAYIASEGGVDKLNGLTDTAAANDPLTAEAETRGWCPEREGGRRSWC